MTGLTFDADAATRHLRRRDARLAALMREVGPFRPTLQRSTDTVSTLARAIVYQQLSGKAAATIFGRVEALMPQGRVSAQGLDALSDDALRAAGVSRPKLAALRDLSARAHAGEVPSLARLRRMEDDAITLHLTRVRGIGRWTVEMLLMFRLGRPDVLPADDLGVQKGFARVYGLTRSERARGLPSRERIAAHAELWRPYRSVGSWYMWRALELPPGSAIRSTRA